MPYENYERWKTTPNQGKPYVSIVIPAYNEAERIVPTVGAIASHVSDLGFEWELIIADDGSTDNSVSLLQDLNLVNMRVLIATKNGGKGSAVRRGMLAAQGEYVLFADADNSTPIENISTLLAKLTEENYDVAIGSRGAEGASESNKSLMRRIMSGGLRLLVRYVLNIRVKDTQCGFKMFTEDAAKRIHGAQTIDGFSFDLEELYLADKYGYRIAEVPVNWMDAPGSTVDARKEAIRFLKDMVRIRWQDLRGSYRKKKRTSDPNHLSVAFVSPYPPSKTSLNEYGYHFIQALAKKDNVEQIYILTDELPQGEQYSAADVPSNVTLMSCWRFGAMDNAKRIAKTVSDLPVDVVIFNIQFASFASTRVAGAWGLTAPWRTRRRAKVPVVVLLHNIMETVNLDSAGFGGNPIITSITRLAGNIMTRLLLRSDLVALTIPKYVEILKSKYGADNVFLAPHGAFDEIPEPDFSDNNSGMLTMMTFGKFGTYKRVEILIEAFEKLQKKHQDQALKLVIAGSDSPNVKGYLAGVQEQYQHVQNVTYTGYVAEEDVPRIFQESDVVVFPYTSTTGSSGVLHQAGSFGRAVVLPHLGDFAELIKEEGYTGEFYEPDDVESLAQAMDTLLQQPVLREKQGRQNYLAAQGVPIDDVIEWYLMQIGLIIQ
jgi:glycosyltransferase involved in cell wall biosynthesis